MPRNNTVGYKKPPRHTRFKPGQSGNPAGRPKGTRNLETDLREELSERILVREGPAEKRISKQRALLKSLVARAIKGDARAAGTLLTMVMRVLQVAAPPPDEASLTAEEQAIFETLEQRLRRQTPRSGRSQPRKLKRRPVRRIPRP